jgi:hypothetical protein
MRALLVVNRRCGFRSASISNASPNADIPVAGSRTSRIRGENMAASIPVRHTL